jgi:hypothetical protein
MLAVQPSSVSNPDPGFIASPISAAVAAILTIAQGVPAIDKRLARVNEIESQVGRLPVLVRRLYIWVQGLYKALLIAITVAGIAMVLAYIFPQWVDSLGYPALSSLKDQGLVLIGIWLVVGAVMYTNVLSWLGIIVWGAIKWPTDHPLPKDPAWHALRSLVGVNENAKPLVVRPEPADALADYLVAALRSGLDVPNRAEPPDLPSGETMDDFRPRLGAGLLAACVIEEAHYDLGMPRRDWGQFYRAVGDLVTDKTLLGAATIGSQYRNDGFYDSLIDRLNKVLSSQGQSVIADSPELKHRLKNTFTALVERNGNDVRRINAGSFWSNARRLDVTYKRLAAFPALKADGRAQFVKLAVVWNVWDDVSLTAFVFPFSKRIAAILLDRGVIRAPEDVKALAFDHPRERFVEQIAEKLVIARAIRLVEERRSEYEAALPTAARRTAGEGFRWWLAYEFDLRLWDYAKRLHESTQVDALMSWRESGGQVIRKKA